MDTFNWLFENLLFTVNSAITNFFLYGFLASMIGLVLGIVLIKKGRKRNLFLRSNGLWTFLAKLNYIALPVAFMVYFGFIGGIYGVHTSVETYIDDATTPIINYATTFLPEFQQFVEHNPNQYASIDQALEAFEKQPSNSRSRQQAEASFGGMNVMIVEGFLEAIGKRADIAAPVIAISQVDPNNIKRSDLELIPLSVKSVLSYWLIPIYWAVCVPFFSFMFIVLAEIYLYRNFFKSKESDDFQFAV